MTQIVGQGSMKEMKEAEQKYADQRARGLQRNFANHIETAWEILYDFVQFEKEHEITFSSEFKEAAKTVQKLAIAMQLLKVKT